MQKFRRKVESVDAAQWLGDSVGEATSFCSRHGMPYFPIGSLNGKHGLMLNGQYGFIVARQGDWVVRLEDDLFIAVPDDEFRDKYEPTNEAHRSASFYISY